jgi:hypothetical protein
VDVKPSHRLQTRLLAIDIRLAELDAELRRDQVRVNHLESELETARLANLLGDEAGNPAELAPELERSRGKLETQREVVARVKKSQWNARVAYTLTRAKERQQERLGAPEPQE